MYHDIHEPPWLHIALQPQSVIKDETAWAAIFCQDTWARRLAHRTRGAFRVLSPRCKLVSGFVFPHACGVVCRSCLGKHGRPWVRGGIRCWESSRRSLHQCLVGADQGTTQAFQPCTCPEGFLTLEGELGRRLSSNGQFTCSSASQACLEPCSRPAPVGWHPMNDLTVDSRSHHRKQQ